MSATNNVIEFCRGIHIDRSPEIFESMMLPTQPESV